jgi:hypothetical protein
VLQAVEAAEAAAAAAAAPPPPSSPPTTHRNAVPAHYTYKTSIQNKTTTQYQ